MVEKVEVNVLTRDTGIGWFIESVVDVTEKTTEGLGLRDAVGSLDPSHFRFVLEVEFHEVKGKFFDILL
jgi:hypothetical protein